MDMIVPQGKANFPQGNAQVPRGNICFETFNNHRHLIFVFI